MIKFLRKVTLPTLGVFGVLFGVGSFYYTEYLKRGDVVVSLVSQGAVLDVRRDLPDLAVLFRGDDLRASGQSLRFYSFMVRNDGTGNVIKSMFDDNVGWGVLLEGATFIRVSDFATASPLLQPVRPTAVQPDRVKFEPAIFDAGESFKFDVLAVYPTSREPIVKLIGGVSGTNFRFAVDNAEKEVGIFESVFVGGLSVQLLKLAFYGFGFILTLVGTLFVVGNATEAWNNFVRGRKWRAALPLTNTEAIAENDVETVRRIFLGGGVRAVRGASKVIRTLANTDTETRIAARTRRSLMVADRVSSLTTRPEWLTYDKGRLEKLGAFVEEITPLLS